MAASGPRADLSRLGFRGEWRRYQDLRSLRSRMTGGTSPCSSSKRREATIVEIED
jgi:hypothetical protein